ncbi:hypothetical protein JM658_10250 [Joostella atrarenae]|uniref:Uncharacterized protein n=1 Tax=Joostella atrarenae TaxID=679257 RepID=A0ABS9J439_9FLAO|nr:hypothetical protein [Joostella atrarenae]MCF8715206.1 hypothetical protein [Joostella atrarenae]
MSKENYDTKLALLQAIPQEAVKTPNMPVDIFLQEAEDLYVWLQKDSKELKSVGLDWQTFVNDLPVRAGALRHAQSLWVAERYGREEARKEWDLVSPQAYELRDDLLNAFRFAYRDRQDLINRVSEISDGYGHPDMIQDLSDLETFGKKNKKELQAIKFDLTLLDIAADTSDEMADLLAKANESTEDNSEQKHIRDQAYTHLYEAVNEIRDTGKYVFRKNPERFKGYISKHKKRNRSS